jgi:hypothetical protein
LHLLLLLVMAAALNAELVQQAQQQSWGYLALRLQQQQLQDATQRQET